MSVVTDGMPADATVGVGPPPIIGRSRTLREAVHLAQRVARSRLPVLLVAPTGSGKDLFAHHIHRWSGRSGELVDVNCAALPEMLLESELFGHAAGAFTGARRPKPGLIEVSDGKSCFLDEISSLSPALQAKLLRVIESQEVRRVGEVGKRRVDVRFLAAAQGDLWDRVSRREFRTDLYHRLAGVVIRIAPLRERPDDVLPLAHFFARRVGRTVEPAAAEVLLHHEWPGNARELRMVIERAACLTERGLIGSNAVAEAICLGAADAGVVGGAPTALGGSGMPDGRSLRGNRGRLREIVARNNGSIARTARTLRLPRATLQRWLREVGL